MEEEHDCAVFDRRGRRARRREAPDGYIVECDASNGFVVEELLAEVDQRLRVGKGSGRSPPCVTRWSGGAVVHDRGALLRRGLRRRTTTHHVVELGSQHYRGQFNVVPGTVFVWTPASHLLVRPEHGGRRRAVDALDGHRFFLVVVMVARQWCRAATAALLALVQHGCHGRSGSFQRCYGCYDSSASAEALHLVAPRACLLALLVAAALKC